MKNNFLKILGLILLTQALATSAFAKHHHMKNEILIQNFSKSICLHAWRTNYVHLNHYEYVTRITFDAYSLNYNGSFKVLSNGRVLGRFNIGNISRKYHLRVDSNIDSLEFVSTTGNTVYINFVKVFGLYDNGYQPGNHYPTPGDFHPIIGGHPYGHGHAVSISKRAIRVIDILDEHTKWEDYGLYLLPIKKVAARALAISYAEGDSSKKTIAQLKELMAQIDTAQKYIDDVLSVDNLFNSYVELLNIRNDIKEMLD